MNARTQIELWLEGHISDDGLTEASSTSATSQTLVTPSETTEHESVTEVAPSLDSDTDDEFKVEEIQVCLRLALEAVTTSIRLKRFGWNHPTAEKFFKRAYVLTRSLSLHKRAEQILKLSQFCQLCLRNTDRTFTQPECHAVEKFVDKAFNLTQTLLCPEKNEQSRLLSQACLNFAQAACGKTQNTLAELFFR